MLIECPFCGERDSAEFDFRITRADYPGSAAERLYLRKADPARSHEHWQHVRGCRLWLELDRDLTTGAVLGVRVLGAEETAVEHP